MGGKGGGLGDGGGACIHVGPLDIGVIRVSLRRG